jgi:hypothetical protein
MRTASVLLVAVGISLMLLGCGGSPQTLQAVPAGDIPEWFTNPPADPNYLFAPSTATSQDLQLAIDKATTAARTEVGRQMEVRVQGIQKKFEEEVGTGADAQMLSQFTQASKTVVSTTLSGSKVKSQKQVQEGNMWRAYVLVQLPVGAAADALLKSMKSNNQSYTRFRSTETFKELNEEAEKYEAFKKAQGQ